MRRYVVNGRSPFVLPKTAGIMALMIAQDGNNILAAQPPDVVEVPLFAAGLATPAMLEALWEAWKAHDTTGGLDPEYVMVREGSRIGLAILRLTQLVPGATPVAEFPFEAR